jgi:hypothetical protein
LTGGSIAFVLGKPSFIVYSSLRYLSILLPNLVTYIGSVNELPGYFDIGKESDVKVNRHAADNIIARKSSFSSIAPVENGKSNTGLMGRKAQVAGWGFRYYVSIVYETLYEIAPKIFCKYKQMTC